MKKTFIYFPFAIILFTVFISCQREIHFDIDPASKGSLKKDINSDCLPIQVAGTFIAGQNTGDTNYIIVEVNVTKTGTYLISTDTVNGFSFKTAGNFANTGSSQVKLVVLGKPVAAGTNNFTVNYDYSSCQVAVIVKNNATGPAGFTLQGAPNACMNAALAGSFAKDIALDTSSKVNIDINVTTPGTYAISTNTVNGYSFSGSGSFSTAGIQTISLTASGTPMNIGANVFTVTAGASSCTFSVTVVAAIAFTNNDHFPLTNNSHWTYDDLFRPGDSIKRSIDDTVTINANLYKIMNEQGMFGPPLPYYFRKSGTNYFEYGSVDKYTGSLQFGPAINAELTFLKENLSTGDSWESAEFTGTATFGQVLKLKYLYYCTNANATVTRNGNTYANVYKMTLKPYIRSLTDGYGPTGEIYTYEYAKGIGIIYAKETNNGFTSFEWQIRNNWLVN